ncbi:SpaA isopeptide-forming pilin-related protein [Ruminococcus intestinalis]|uniref:SpaA isopeptide-forming pilin-related protein n=1 Tax=Ruminococcus intestinalis TaxID=2763066 RepID=UPI003F7DF854
MNKIFKRITASVISLMTILTMFPISGITASAASYGIACGVDEIGGKVLIESSEKPIVLVNNGSGGRLDAYKFKFNGEIGYCIDPQSYAQTTKGETIEFTEFYGETGKEIIKLNPSSSNAAEKALIAGEELLYAKHFFDSKEIIVEGKTMKQYMYDKFIGPKAAYKYSSFFSAAKISDDDALYILSHFALSQLYHTMIEDKSTSWKTWSGYSDISEMVNMIVDVCQRVSQHSGNYSKIASYASTTNIYIAHPKPKTPKDGTYQHLIVEIPKKAKLSLQKAGTNDTIKNLTEATQDKDYLNFEGAEYTLYKKSDNSVVAVAQLSREGTISKILYSYSNKEWISKSYFELEAGEYYLKETKAPNSGKYFTLDTTEYPITVTSEDCIAEKTLDVLNVTDTEIVRLNIKKISSEPSLTENNDCYDLDGTEIAIFPNERSAYEYIADNTKTDKILRYFQTDSLGNTKAISKDGINWDTNAKSDLYKITYSDKLYAVETKAGKGFEKFPDPIKLELLENETYGGYALLGATIANIPKNDPIGIQIQKKNAVTGQTVDMGGAEFTLKFYKGFYDSADVLAGLEPERKWVLRTDVDGYTHLNDNYRSPDNDFGEDFYLNSIGVPTLPLGTLSIQETKAPDGFKVNPKIFIRQIKQNEATGDVLLDNEVEVLEEPDTIYGNLTIYKTADDSKRGANTAKDVWFNVKSDDGVTDENIVTKSKGIDGAATLSDLPVYKASGEYVKYIITELGYKNADGTYYFPTKYVKPAAQTVTLEDSKSIIVKMYNSLVRGSVRLTKTDGTDNPLKGIEFELYNTKTGIVNVINKNSSIMYEAADSKTADTVTKLVTDSDGRIIVNNLLPGDYYFIETDSKGNMPYAGKINFTISPDSLDTLDIQLTVKNNSVFIPETGGTGNNRPIYIEIGAAVLAFTILVGAIGLGIRKKKKHIGKKAQQ